ncbi:alpha,alpha-trehalase TreF [Novosphingobium sp. TCA1]|uniref:alpha,alpha-trehalase TreF n=1 Tax=Novosphingobium sp. TCA1 TaxID=2682474 RepID=UPI001307E03B|nr:alpha,alpha-trehalase TreF [Novosphingobium sp. TCA1]GFE74965.1 periplasmic trehalase [Novosphingobium sp. TCA1]
MPSLPRRVFAAALLCAALCANTAPPTPADRYGALFTAVQEQRIFEDGKTFVDAVPKAPPEEIIRSYAAQTPKTPAELKAFVLSHFTVPGVNETPALPLRQHVQALWPHLVRRDAAESAPYASAIALPGPYVVPGGRFREMYYWDSYFTMLGLAADGRDDLVESMIDDFVSLIERFGHIPNGTRTYYLSRSQPPFFALMLDLSKQTDPALRARRLAALRKEHAYWMAGESCARQARKPCDRVMPMPDGSLLNRYWDDRDTPRDESFAEDRATAAKTPDRPATQMYRDLRAGAESGWDFSARWLTDPRDLSTIRTTVIVPIDLNALLWAMETGIAKGCAEAADRPCQREFNRRADARKAAVDRYLWRGKENRYADWSRDSRKPTAVLSSATLYPLFIGMASPAQAKAVAATTRDKLVAPGGLRTTAVRSGQQWDAPNGWAPLQWVALDGLGRYGEHDLARDIASRWIRTVSVTYHDTGKMLEKYDVEEQLPGGGGEYPLQDGFGWTNGVTSAILERYPTIAP